MSNVTVEDIKRHYEAVSNVFEQIEYYGCVDINLNMSYRELLRLEIAEYMMYLSASDGVLTSSEVDMFNRITSCNYDIDGIVDYINEHRIYSERFESTVPISMEIAVQEELNGISEKNLTFPEIVFCLFEDVGRKMMEIDGEVSHSERRDYRIYLNMLDSYLEDMGFTCKY